MSEPKVGKRTQGTRLQNTLYTLLSQGTEVTQRMAHSTNTIVTLKPMAFVLCFGLILLGCTQITLWGLIPAKENTIQPFAINTDKISFLHQAAGREIKRLAPSE